MRLTAFIALLGLASCWLSPALAGDHDDILAAYQRFLGAQNARDLERAKAELIETPDALWVSDGKSIWTREAIVARMSQFQKLEVWHAEPLLDKARIVDVATDVAYLHMPLDLKLGTAAEPSLTRFLVSILFRRTPAGWKIAALFTTLDNQ